MKCTSNNISNSSNFGTESRLKVSKSKKKGVFLEDIHVVVETGYGNQSFYHGNTEYATWFQVLYLSVHLFKFCLLDIFLKDIIINVLIGIEEKNSFDYFVFVVVVVVGGGGGGVWRDFS